MRIHLLFIFIFIFICLLMFNTFKGIAISLFAEHTFWLYNDTINGTKRGVTMIQNRGFKFRLYPNKNQATFFNKTIGCARFVFYFFVAKQKDKDAYWYIVRNGAKRATSCKQLERRIFSQKRVH